MRPSLTTRLRPRYAAGLLGLLIATAAAPALAGRSQSELESGISSSTAKENSLKGAIQADSSKIDGFQGNIDDLQSRLSALESSLDVERELLDKLRSELKAARTHLASLQVQLGRDKKVLVEQVVAAYEAPPPSIVTVIMEAHGFSDLLERLDDLKAIGQQNATATTQVIETRAAVSKQAKRLAVLTSSHQHETVAVLVQRDEVARLHLALVDHQLEYIHARDQKSSELGQLHSHRQALEKELASIQISEYSSQSQSFSGSFPIEGGGSSGSYGFFQAPDTNYSVGEEPVIVSRLNTLGKALHLHLIGISGYRTPEHSVEVGGFANDPHTRGEASDTPGVEGVPESVLEHFGLTRPFPGPAEADHIQLLGSIH
jgi:peptidoglycan hydrolase CwlO-like protein